MKISHDDKYGVPAKTKISLRLEVPTSRICKRKGNLETFANQVLPVVGTMPQQWMAGIDNNNAINSYQILTFRIAEGMLNQVLPGKIRASLSAATLTY